VLCFDNLSSIAEKSRAAKYFSRRNGGKRRRGRLFGVEISAALVLRPGRLPGSHLGRAAARPGLFKGGGNPVEYVPLTELAAASISRRRVLYLSY